MRRVRRGQLGRVVGHGERVEVDDAEDRVVVQGGVRARDRLVVDPAPDRAQVVAELHVAGGLDAREDPRHAAETTGAGAFSLVNSAAGRCTTTV